AIFEVKAKDFPIGSICGGGRYDNLTGIFGLPDMSGVGISFGADRIYDVLKGLDKFPSEVRSTTRILFANMGDAELRYLIPIVKSLRESGISCEIYPESSKLKKQFDYADKKSIPFISITGTSEAEQSVINLKNLASGEQKSFAKDDLAGIISFVG
ncbi:MAG: His/Gly/Thr/Pro-type tRNA ligase C-terminal domain-containing protein, partial [Candidatus Cryptobacteroides sp.]